MTSNACRIPLLLLLALALVGCTRRGPLPMPVGQASPAAVLSAPAVRFGHVAIIVLENHEASAILGNLAAPFINELARDYRLFGQYYAVAHPSLPNYLALAGGSTFGIQSDCTSCLVSAPSIADQAEAAGRSWKAYLEDMPEPCALRDAGRYAVRHNPFVYFTGLRSDTARCRAHVQPLTQLAQDIAGGAIPDLAWIVPNLCNDMHDCDVATGDGWLSRQVPALLAASAFASDGLLLITWDEGTSDFGCCGAAGGGRVVALAVSARTRGIGSDDTAVSHYSLLRTTEDALGLPPLGAAATAAPLPVEQRR